MKKPDLKFNARAIHAGSRPCPVTGAHIGPIYRTSTFVMDNVEQAIRISQGEEEGYSYGRFGNPTETELEEKMAALENGEKALATASGMAAITTTLMTFLKNGDHLIAGDIIYGCTYGLIRDILTKFGIEVTFVDTSDLKNIEKAVQHNTKVIYLETPCNPVLKLADIKGAAEIAHNSGASLIVDSTFATPYLQNPLDLGADVVVHSATKYLGGHGDIVGGIIVGPKETIAGIRDPHLQFFGGIISPGDAFLITRGLKTLGIRMKSHCENAQKVAEFLEDHPMVEKVYYPGLASHPQHELARRQMRGFGGMMSFDVRGGFAGGKTVMNNVRMISLATSLGCIDSLIQHSPSMSHFTMSKEEREKVSIMEGQVRLSVGIEEAENTIADLENALAEVKKVVG